MQMTSSPPILVRLKSGWGIAILDVIESRVERYLYYWLDLLTGSNCWGGVVRDIPPKRPTPDGDSMDIPG
jgi:hypothetical protein